MDCYFNSDGCFAYHRFTNVEFTGVFGEDYHLFIKYGDKVYMEVKGVGEVVISFDELQKNKHWKHWKQYYDLSLLLTPDKHSLAQDIVYSSNNSKNPDAYNEARFWSVHTAFMETENDARIIREGYVCYYKINPFDLENMEYTSKEDLDVFEETYRNTRSELIDDELAFYNELATKAIEEN